MKSEYASQRRIEGTRTVEGIARNETIKADLRRSFQEREKALNKRPSSNRSEPF